MISRLLILKLTVIQEVIIISLLKIRGWKSQFCNFNEWFINFQKHYKLMLKKLHSTAESNVKEEH